VRGKTHRSWWARKEGLIGLLGALLLWTAPCVAQEEQVVSAGQVDFQTYCTACHGQDGKGAGPMASQLQTKPADLTQVSKKNDGIFPVWQTYRIIDGTEPLARMHGSEEMPLWGDVFKAQEGSATALARVRGRIFQLIYYLQSIQAK